MFSKSSILILNALALGLPSMALADEVAWQSDYVHVRQEAAAKNRPMIVKIGSERCGWCHRLEATTFRDPAVIRRLRESFVALEVDAARQRWLVQALKVEAFPTVIFAAPDGTILKWQEGYVGPAVLLRQIDEVSTRSATNSQTSVSHEVKPAGHQQQ